MPTIHGTIDPPAQRTRVLALAADLSRALASTVIDGAAFALDGDDDAIVLARLQGPIFAMAHGRGSDPLALDPRAHAALLAVAIRADGEVPPAMQLGLVPERVPGFPDGPAQVWTYRIDAVTNEGFATWPLVDGAAALTVQAGTWRIDATHAEGVRGLTGAGGPTRWYVAAAHDDRGAPLLLGPGGATVVVDRAMTVTLTIAKA